MSAWPDTRLLELTGADLPIVQAPMAGAGGVDLAASVCAAGGIGSLPCAMLDVDTARAQIGMVRQQTRGPVNLNFFCHDPSPADPDRERVWREQLVPYYEELGVEPPAGDAPGGRTPFDAAMCEVVELTRPEVVSFHFGLPSPSLLDRVLASGTVVISSATTVAEARWLEARGCHAVIAQGAEAGGHRGMFLEHDISTQVGTFALVPQVVDAVSVPVIAAGGIADGRGIAAAFALGAAGVQMGSVYLRAPQSMVSPLHREALETVDDNSTALTNLFSGRPARGVMNRIMREQGPMSPQAPAFPTAGAALAPLKKAAEAAGDSGFSSLWAGQAAALGQPVSADELTRHLAADALERLRVLSRD